MPTIVSEAYQSRGETDGDQLSYDYIYICSGSDDKTTVKTAILAVAPASVGAAIRATYDDEQIGPQLWKATVNYTTEEREDADSNFAFDTTGGTTTIKQSLATTKYDHHEHPAPDFKGAINVSSDRNVAGVDIIIPALKYTETHWLGVGTVTLSFVKNLADMTGSTNNAAWKGWAEGEARFDGATGAQAKAGGQWQVTFKFTVEPNIELNPPNITGGPVEKAGHQYFWTYYGEEEDDKAKRIVATPQGAYVETVYPPKNFALIGIGT